MQKTYPVSKVVNRKKKVATKQKQETLVKILVEKRLKEANIHSDLSQYCWAGEDNYVYMFSKRWAVRLSDGAYDWSDISVKKDYKRYNAVCYFFNENGEVW